MIKRDRLKLNGQMPKNKMYLITNNQFPNPKQILIPNNQKNPSLALRKEETIVWLLYLGNWLF
jgi:hypothetical protein